MSCLYGPDLIERMRRVESDSRANSRPKQGPGPVYIDLKELLWTAYFIEA
jgi:hypothetical protein